MMRDHIRDGYKIFVIKSGQGRLSQEIALSVSQALRAHGRSWLLWVEPGAEVGRVDVLADGLIRGTIDRLTVEPNGWDLSLAGRLAVLSKAWRMVGPLLPDDAAELE